MSRIVRAIALGVSCFAALAGAADARAAGYGRLGPGESTLVCESVRGRDNFCAASIGGRVQVVRELSKAPCVEGDTWRYDARGIYVRNGCRAEFAYRTGGGWGGRPGWGDDDRPGWGNGGPGWGRQAFVIRCESVRGRWAECPVDIAGRVELQQQESRSACIRGRTWGTQGRDAIWVSDGCRGRFLVTGRASHRPMRSGDGGAPPGARE